jgi:hypothetical protein
MTGILAIQHNEKEKGFSLYPVIQSVIYPKLEDVPVDWKNWLLNTNEGILTMQQFVVACQKKPPFPSPYKEEYKKIFLWLKNQSKYTQRFTSHIFMSYYHCQQHLKRSPLAQKNNVNHKL